MAFDPTKPYGTIHGHCTVCPGAKYEQKGKFYDTHKSEVVKGQDPAPVQESTSTATPPPATPPPAPEKPPETLESLQKKLKKAQTQAKKYPTPAKREAVTELEKKISDLAE